MLSSFSGSINFGRRPAVVSGGGSGSMRALLSASGKTAYDAATDNSWFSVSAADYAAVYAGLSGTTKVGMDDTQIATPASAFVGTYGVTLPQSYSTVAANSYVVGMVIRTAGTAGTFRPYISTTFKGSTYNAMGTNTITTAAVTTLQYYLCRAPSLQGSTSYVAIGPRSAGGGNWSTNGTTGSWNGAGYTATMNPASWTVWNNSTPIQQWLATTTQP